MSLNQAIIIVCCICIQFCHAFLPPLQPRRHNPLTVPHIHPDYYGSIILILQSGAPSTTKSIIEYDDLLPCPNPDIEPLQVVQLCMDSLMTKDNNEGLEVCFNFSSDYLKAAFGSSLEKFIQHANNPIFASLVHCTQYQIVSIGPVIPGTNTRGAMQTFLMDVQATNSEDRRFLWTLQRERRPPRSNCWLVHEVLFVKNAFQLTL